MSEQGPGAPPAGAGGPEAEAASDLALGGQLLVASNAALRVFKIHSTDNKAVLRPIDNLLGALESLIESRGEVSLLMVESVFYLGDTRMRLSGAQQGIADALTKEFQLRGIGGLKFNRVPPREQLVTLFKALSMMDASGDEAAVGQLRRELAREGVDAVSVSKPLRAITEEEEENQEVTGKMAKVYTSAIRGAGSVLKSMGDPKAKGGDVRAQRLVQEFVDLSEGDPALFLSLAGLRGTASEEVEHTISVSVLSIAFGRRLGLDKLALADLGMAAMFHDAGRQQLGETANVPASLPPLLAVKVLAERTHPPPRVMRQVIVAFEHQLDIAGGGVPGLRFKKRIHPLSQIVRLAKDFDDLTRGRSGTAPLGVDDAMARMRQGSGKAYHSGLLGVFQDLILGEEAEIAEKPGVEALAAELAAMQVEGAPAPTAKGKRQRALGALKLKRISTSGAA